jgi:hypothetical protein
MRRHAASDRLLVRFVGNQTAVIAAHRVDARASQASHAYIGPIVVSFRCLIEDVLNV